MLIRRAMHESGLTGEIAVAGDGEEALRVVNRLDANLSLNCPAVVVLDLNLPKVHGRDVLKHLRQSSRFRAIPVVVLSSSDAEKDRAAMAELGVARYIPKPLDLEEFMDIGRIIEDVLREYERA